jgi:hypothetical protein
MNESENKSCEIPTWAVVAASFLGIILLGTIIIPNFIKARATSAANACINNLRQIDAAANQFALEHNLSSGTPINFPNDLTPYIKLNSAGKIPGCPQGGLYSIWRVGQAPKCTLGTTNYTHALP